MMGGCAGGTQLAIPEDMPQRLLPATKAGPIDRVIHVIRYQRVLLDADLAALYGVDTKALVQAVKRNLARFPTDFMFQRRAVSSQA
jgi:hypothetical protein